MAGWTWTGQREEAAALVAADLLSDAAICEEIGVKTRDTLWRWKQQPEFAARIQEIKSAIRAQVKMDGIAIMENRVAAQNDRWKRLQAVMQARAADPEYKAVPGGDTGLLKREIQLVKVWMPAGAVVEEQEDQPHGGSLQRKRKTDALINAGYAEEVIVYPLDSALLREFREIEKQSAQELGQWQEKQQVEETRRVTIRTLSIAPPAPAADGS